MPGEGLSTWADTKARARVLVESIPLYRAGRSQLIEWCQDGLSELGLVADFMTALERYLRDYPFYASSLEDLEGGTRPPVNYRDVPSVAKELQIKESYLRKHLSTMETSLPFGSFNSRRHWNIHPLDVDVLKQHFVVAGN